MNKVHYRIILMFLCTMIVGCAKPKSPLIKLNYTSDLSTVDVKSGSFDSSIDAEVKYRTKLSDCAEEVAISGENWAKAENLSITRKELAKGKAILHISSANGDGFFELKYRLQNNEKAAILSFIFLNDEGDIISAANESSVDSVDVNNLRKELESAMTCTK